MEPRLTYHMLQRVAKNHPDKTAILYKGTGTSYRELLDRAEKTAAFISSCGTLPGFRAGILSDDPVEYISSYFGIQMAGGVSVGLNTQTTPRSLSYHINDCQMDGLAVGKRFLRILKETFQDVPTLKFMVANSLEGFPSEKVNNSITFKDLWEYGSSSFEPPFRSSCDLAQIIYTSGTTGKPKGVMLRHSNLLANTKSIVKYLGITGDDRVMAVLPFFYSYGNSIMLTHICQGATLVVNQNMVYPNVILKEMEDNEVTGFSGVPSTFAILLHRSNLHEFSFPKLRYITQAGAPMSPALAIRLKEAFPGVNIYIMYGQTEASARLSYLPPADLLKKAGSIGIPIPGVELSLLDESGEKVPVGQTGEIVARGENIMAGYWNSPEETAKVLRPEGLRTGDLAWQDDDGYFYIVSRKSDMIKSGSHRIAPKEIEDVVMEHSEVSEAAVVGVEDDILGEAIWLFVVLKPGSNCKLQEIKKHCRRLLPAFKVPHKMVITEALPKTATGKIKKNDLKKQASERISNR